MSILLKKAGNALQKLKNYSRKKWWRLTHNYTAKAKPVFICGVQRSGTTMLGACLERSPEIWHYPEHDTYAFENYILKDSDTITSLVKNNPFKTLVFKPLTDSHRVKDLMERFGDGAGIWMYRRYEDRANSAVVKFGAHNLEVLSDIANDTNLDIWQAQGLLDEDIELIKSYDYSKMNPAEAATLFWYFRNKLYFNQALDKDERVLLVCYEDLIRKPEKTMRDVCIHLGITYRPFLIKGIHARSFGKQKAPDIRNDIKMRCEHMYKKLDEMRLS